MQGSREITTAAPVVGAPSVPPGVLVGAEKPLESANGGHVPSTELPTTSPDLSEKEPAGVIVDVSTPLRDSTATAPPPSYEPVEELGEKRPIARTDTGANTAPVITEPKTEPVEKQPKTNEKEAAKLPAAAVPLEPIQQFPPLKNVGSPSTSKSSALPTRKRKKTICERILSIFSHDNDKKNK